jgi:hypothetical protein
MAFWKKPSSPAQSGEHNPYRSLDPTGFDKGAKINRRAEELRRFAAEGLTESDAITAIGTALGNAAAAMQAQHPSLSLEEILELACAGVREAADVATGVFPKNDDARELTNDEFNGLTNKIIRIATANGTLSHDALATTAKALGVLLTFEARRQGRTIDELVGIGQQMIAGFAASAGTYMLENPNADPAKNKTS